MVTGRNALSGTVTMKSMGSPAIADICMACAGSTEIKGSETIQGPEAATKTSSMPKLTFGVGVVGIYAALMFAFEPKLSTSSQYSTWGDCALSRVA
jgi:hypothetical protein